MFLFVTCGDDDDDENGNDIDSVLLPELVDACLAICELNLVDSALLFTRMMLLGLSRAEIRGRTPLLFSSLPAVTDSVRLWKFVK